MFGHFVLGVSDNVTWRFMGIYKYSRVISRVTILITHIRGLITLLISTHEPPSRGGQVKAPCNEDLLSGSMLGSRLSDTLACLRIYLPTHPSTGEVY